MKTPSYPIWGLDFQSSSRDTESFPIEVGIACWPRPQAEITWWSTLIRPEAEWVDWSDASESHHGISRTDLNRAPSVEAVAELLNRDLRDGVAYCNGGSYDSYWTTTLFRSARRYPTFILTSWEEILQTMERSSAADARAYARTNEPHRAGPAAAHMIKAMAHAMGLEPGLREAAARVTPEFL